MIWFSHIYDWFNNYVLIKLTTVVIYNRHNVVFHDYMMYTYAGKPWMKSWSSTDISEYIIAYISVRSGSCVFGYIYTLVDE